MHVLVATTDDTENCNLVCALHPDCVPKADDLSVFGGAGFGSSGDPGNKTML